MTSADRELAVTTLQNLGIEPGRDEDAWCARVDGRKFYASDPVRLVGLLALWLIAETTGCVTVTPTWSIN